jgi:hypothetical protein
MQKSEGSKVKAARVQPFLPSFLCNCGVDLIVRGAMVQSLDNA